jgi:ketosteroid isomerase-like protein
MSREANVEVVRRSFDAFESKDMEAWTADWAEDIVFDVTHYEPWTGAQKVYRGELDVLAFFAEMMAGVRVLKVDVAELTEIDEHRVMALYTEYRQAPGDREPHDLHVGIVYTLRDGKIARVQVHSSHEAARRTAQSPAGA